MTPLTAFALGAVAGAGAMYVLDPAAGRSRRDAATDQLRATAEVATDKLGATADAAQDRVSGTLDHVTNKVTGAVAGALPDSKPANDHVLADKVRSEVLGRDELSGLGISVDAAQGVVTLRGEVPSSDLRDDLEDAVGKVTGVDEVANLLHLPGETPSNAIDSRAASSGPR
jgi:osmotically-inducible protein OsmY